MNRTYSSMIVGLVFLILSPNLLFAEMDLKYRDRGDRHEGIKEQAIAGLRIELISVLVNHEEALADLPGQIKVKFFLEKPADVYLTVRELDYEHYYWLDRVLPPTNWKPGFDNEFVWSTNTVLRQLKGLQLEHLGTLIRLNSESPSNVEYVAPAILYGEKAPQQVKGYFFALKTSRKARVKCFVYREKERQSIALTPNLCTSDTIGGRSFKVEWNAVGVEPGIYKLVVDGYLSGTNQKIGKIVRFFHNTSVR